LVRLLSWFVICLTLGATALADDRATAPRATWSSFETENFRYWCSGSPHNARELAGLCEVWRTRLVSAWQPDSERWTVKCDVCVHPNQTAYNRTLNRVGDSSVGATTLRMDAGRVVCRRIDLRADAADWADSALPHELTHVVLADQFSGNPLPRWADEGLAMLSESPAKRELRLGHLRNSLAGQPTYRLQDLLHVEQLPPAHLRDAFYGQSLALTSWLIERRGSDAFRRFLEAARDNGVDRALRDELHVAGIDALQHEWSQWTRTPHAMRITDLWGPDANRNVALE
jgi:hypothetical protein